GGAPALHDAALPEHRGARDAARRLALDLRAREALPVLPGERVLDGDAQHGAGGMLGVLRGDGGPRAHRRRDRARHGGRAGGGGRAPRRERRRVCRAEADRVRVRRVRPALLRGDAGDLRVPRAERDLPARAVRRVDVQRDGGLRAGGAGGGGLDRRGRGVSEGGAPHVSVVIPVYNEEGILRGSVLELEEKLRRFGWSYELLLSENGSRDRTIEIGKELQAEHPQVRMLSVGQPNYGLALRQGILEARGHFVICDEIDLLDTEFYARAMALLERSDTDLVVGS